jgi:nucleoside-diphosphate-sugar epimerase
MSRPKKYPDELIQRGVRLALEGERPIELEDAARAVADALERDSAGSVYNVVDDQPVSMRVYIGEIVRLSGSRPARRMPYCLVNVGASYIAPVFGGGHLRFSNAKLKLELGWSPRYPSYARRCAP